MTEMLFVNFFSGHRGCGTPGSQRCTTAVTLRDDPVAQQPRLDCGALGPLTDTVRR